MHPWHRKVHISKAVVRYVQQLPAADQAAFVRLLRQLDRDPFEASVPIAQSGAMHLRVATFAAHRLVVHFDPWERPMGKLLLLEAEPVK